MLKGGVSCKNGVVRLNNSSRDLRSWVDCKLKLRLLAVVNRQTFHQEGSKARTSTSTEAVEDQETLQPSALVGLEMGRKS